MYTIIKIPPQSDQKYKTAQDKIEELNKLGIQGQNIKGRNGSNLYVIPHEGLGRKILVLGHISYELNISGVTVWNTDVNLLVNVQDSFKK